jgi:signal transduction histidine kinase
MSVLLVDDDPADRRLIREVVGDVLHATNPAALAISECECLADATRYVADHTVDCVLLDLSLPDATGLKAVEAIRAVAPDTPIVVLSAIDDEAVAIASLNSGAEDYLLKGESDGRVIVRAVRYAIERTRADAHQLATERALHRSERHQREILTSILQTEEAERARIATALHDDTVQVMAASLMALDRLALVARKAGDHDVESAVMATRETLEEATERTRRLMFELRPAILHELGLRAAITVLADEVARETGARSEVRGDVGRYGPVVEELVYRCVQEALANVRKHARPRTITVTLEDASDVLTCEVADDGRGFDVERVSSRPQSAFHLGLDSLTERVRAAGGQVTIISTPGQGTRVLFTVPFSRPRDNFSAPAHGDLGYDVSGRS